MSLLLDTHTLLWFLREPGLLPGKVTAAIESAGKQAFVSMATLWEIAIKVSINKLSLPGEFEAPSSTRLSTARSYFPISRPSSIATGVWACSC